MIETDERERERKEQLQDVMREELKNTLERATIRRVS